MPEVQCHSHVSVRSSLFIIVARKQLKEHIKPLFHFCLLPSSISKPFMPHPLQSPVKVDSILRCLLPMFPPSSMPFYTYNPSAIFISLELGPFPFSGHLRPSCPSDLHLRSANAEPPSLFRIAILGAVCRLGVQSYPS